MDGQKGFIYSIQRYSIHDGPGVRTNVFFKGCQLHCPWCANPESQKVEREISFISHKCTDCGMCLKKCPKGAIDLARTPRVDRAVCDLCGQCVKYCPVDCYKIFGEEITAEELLQEVLKDQAFYHNSGGGVTVSGGEPTLQLEFLLHFLKLCKESGVNTAMESHAYGEEEAFRALIPLVDHFLPDVKHMDSELHEKVIGVPNGPILRNIRMLVKEGCRVSVRVPFIPGFNDSEKNMRELGAFAKELLAAGDMAMVHLLPYHSLGKSKYESLDRGYSMDGTKPPENETMEEWKEFLEKEFGLPVTIGG